MNINLVIGLAIAVLAILYGNPDIRIDYALYLQMNSFILVAGGTIGSTFISTSMKDLKNLLKVFGKLMTNKQKLTPEKAVKALVRVSALSQKGNKQAYINEGRGLGDGFLHRALSMVAAGLEKDFIDQTLETDIIEVRRRHSSMIGIIRTMGSYAPMFGMAGTVMGVIQVLKNVTNIDNIVSGMALALLTTLYGLIFSSIIFIPMANRLRMMSDEEVLVKDIIREGVQMVMDKEIPLKVEKYLSAYLASTGKKNEKKI